MSCLRRAFAVNGLEAAVLIFKAASEALAIQQLWGPLP